MGEELWSRFLPKYLESLGATVWIVALYGTLKDLLEAIYPYPGGWMADRFGRRTSLLIFTSLACVGYLSYLVAGSWPLILAGTVFVMSWSSLTLPALFASIGDYLPTSSRAMGFGIQSILKRIPIVIAPAIGGWLIAQKGLQSGIKTGLWITILLAAFSIFLLAKYFREKPVVRDRHGIGEIWKGMDPNLKRLLIADCLARWAEGIPKVFIVLYVMNVLKVNALQFGWLTAIMMISSIVFYLPVAKMADRLNRKPFVILTFMFFALFPVSVALSSGFAALVIAFMIGGLREIGEPARKAIIVDLAVESARGRSVGIYYLIRGLAVFPASLAGGWLWEIHPQYPFYVAFGIGIAGCLVFLRMGKVQSKD